MSPPDVKASSGRPSSSGGEDAGDCQFVPAVRRKGETVQFRVDGCTVSAHTGQSILSAVLENGRKLRHSEFTGEPRAGFCLMSACQDCWMWTDQGARLRSCSTPVSPGLTLYTTTPSHLKDE